MQAPHPSNDPSALLPENLTRVFNQRDATLRLQALGELYTQDAVLYEPQNLVTGHAEISATVGALLASLPPDFVFTAEGAAVGHHDLWCLHWHGGPPGGPAVITGTDVAHLKDGRISALYVLINAPSPE